MHPPSPMCVMNPELGNADALVLGQVITSRTETVEDYLKDRCHKLATIGLTGIRQRFGGRCTLYEKGKRVNTFPLPSLYVKGSSLYYQPLTFFYYLFQSFLIILSILRLKMRFNFAIGISTFYAFMNILLKRLGFVNHIVYYSIDYYPAQSFMNTIFRKLDKFCVENSDIIWNLSSAISKARHTNIEGDLKDLTEILVPLTYSSKLLTFRPFKEIERWSIAFVGTLVRLQGLQLLIEAMPQILEHLPNVVVKVIGDGPFAGELKRLVRESGLNEHFIFYGFIKEESKVINILSRCAIGVAPFIPIPENNALTADPGKPKLYTFLGLPVIITKIPSGILIDNKGAGIAIDYDLDEFANAVIKLLKDDQSFIRYRQNAISFAKCYTSERIFKDAIETTMETFRQRVSREKLV